jgi:hypothetical protein
MPATSGCDGVELPNKKTLVQKQKRRPGKPDRRLFRLNIDLDDVDFSREVAGHFEANFLLANCGLRPDFHGNNS